MKQQRQLAELIDLYFAKKLDAEEKNELEAILRADETSRQEFWRQCELEGLL